jgi:hypothetical protein
MKNECGKMRDKNNPYEVWATPDGSWQWRVLKKYKSPESEAKDPYARWMVWAKSPFCPDGEMGDTYIRDIKAMGGVRIV